jgi:hypothetical protein
MRRLRRSRPHRQRWPCCEHRSLRMMRLWQPSRPRRLRSRQPLHQRQPSRRQRQPRHLLLDRAPESARAPRGGVRRRRQLQLQRAALRQRLLPLLPRPRPPCPVPSSRTTIAGARSWTRPKPREKLHPQQWSSTQFRRRRALRQRQRRPPAAWRRPRTDEARRLCAPPASHLCHRRTSDRAAAPRTQLLPLARTAPVPLLLASVHPAAPLRWLRRRPLAPRSPARSPTPSVGVRC